MSSRSTIIFSATVIAAIAVIGIVIWPRNPGEQPSPESPLEDAVAGPPIEQKVELLPEKLAAAKLGFAKVERTVMQPESIVPGRLQYDDRRHVEIRSATDGVITEIHVKPGDHVRSGDVLVILNSTEVGNARADVLQRTSAVQIAARRQKWERAICNGLSDLADAVRKRLTPDEIRTRFEDVVLGQSREQLLTAYSDLLLAETLLSSVTQSAENGAVSGRVLKERQSTRDQAEAKLTAALEELTFRAEQSCQEADAQLADAEQRLKISRQAVGTLLGDFGMPTRPDAAASPETPVEPAASGDPDETDEEPLSLVKLRAPFDGTIEQRTLTRSERVDAGTTILVLADTSTLWVAADLREHDWGALSLAPGDAIRVSTAVPGLQSVMGTVHFLGREVSSLTNAVPLVAVIENPDHRLRPGMPVQVAIPAGQATKVLTVPEAAVQQQEGRSFVFVAEGPATFRSVDLLTGMNVNGRMEILSGLAEGDEIVSVNAFLLKSELLLQGEEE